MAADEEGGGMLATKAVSTGKLAIVAVLVGQVVLSVKGQVLSQSLRCAETVRSGATHDTARSENWLREREVALLFRY